MEMSIEEKNKRIHEILGIKWSETTRIPNYDFYTDAGAIQLLRELEKQEWYFDFISTVGIYVEFLTTPGLLADKLLEWRKVNDR